MLCLVWWGSDCPEQPAFTGRTCQELVKKENNINDTFLKVAFFEKSNVILDALDFIG